MSTFMCTWHGQNTRFCLSRNMCTSPKFHGRFGERQYERPNMGVKRSLKSANEHNHGGKRANGGVPVFLKS